MIELSQNKKLFLSKNTIHFLAKKTIQHELIFYMDTEDDIIIIKKEKNDKHVL